MPLLKKILMQSILVWSPRIDSLQDQVIICASNFPRDEERSPERLLLLNCNHIRLGSEHIESGMPLDSLFLERSTAYRFCVPFQWSWISPKIDFLKDQ